MALALALAPSVAEAQEAAVYSADGRAVAGFFLHYGSAGAVADATEVLASFDRVLEEDTGLVRARLPVTFASRCTEDFTVLDLCVLQTLFPDLDVVRPDATLPSPEEAALQVAALRRQPQLVVNVAVAQVRGQRQARFRVFSSTTAAAAIVRAQLAARAEGEPMDELELQSVLSEQAVRTVVLEEQDSLSDPRLHRDVFSRLDSLISAFPEPGVVFIPGEGVPPQAEITLDGQVLGPVVPAGVRIVDVKPGRHEVSIRAPGYSAVVAQVDVARGAQTEIPPFTLVNLAQAEVASAVRTGTIIGGAAVAAAGAGLLIWAQSSAGAIGCTPTEYDGVVSECPSGGYAGSEPLDTRLRQYDGQPLPTGAPLVPLGVGLLGAGASWALGAWLSDEGEWPWLPVVIGAVVGGAAAGVAVALEP